MTDFSKEVTFKTDYISSCLFRFRSFWYTRMGWFIIVIVWLINIVQMWDKPSTSHMDIITWRVYVIQASLITTLGIAFLWSLAFALITPLVEYSKKDKKLNTPSTLVLSSAGIKVTDKNSTQEWNWKANNIKLDRGFKSLYFYITKSSAYIIPKSAFRSADDMNEFINYFNIHKLAQ